MLKTTSPVKLTAGFVKFFNQKSFVFNVSMDISRLNPLKQIVASYGIKLLYSPYYENLF